MSARNTQQARNKKINNLTLAKLDHWLLYPFIMLSIFGLIMVASSSISIADHHFGEPLHYFYRQLVFLILGILLLFCVIKLPLDWWYKMSPYALFFAFVLLLLLLMPGIGHTVNGSTRWLNFGIARFQVAEAVKLLLIIYLAGYLTKHKAILPTHIIIPLRPLIFAVLLAGLLLMQPDFGSTVIILSITGIMVWLAGTRWKHVTIMASIVLPALMTVMILEPYRVRRFISFLDPWADPYADGFQLTQALIAIGRGEIFGVGIGSSVQKLFYLPEAHTDFIFAVIAEELGLVGVAIVLTLFIIMLGRTYFITLKLLNFQRFFSAYLAIGIALWFSLQVVISVGVNLGILPTKGLTLPFISAGGSSLLVCVLGIGLLLRISYELSLLEKPKKQRVGKIKKNSSTLAWRQSNAV